MKGGEFGMTPKQEVRQSRINVAVTAEEKEEFKQAALAEGLTLSAYIRFLLRNTTFEAAHRTAYLEADDFEVERPEFMSLVLSREERKHLSEVAEMLELKYSVVVRTVLRQGLQKPE